MPDSAAPPAKPAPRVRALRIALVVLGVAAAIGLLGLAWAALPLEQWLDAFRAWVEGLGVLGWLVFILAYALLASFFAPGALTMMAGGLIFGLAGIGPVMGGVLLCGVAGFYASRSLARDRVARFLEGRPRMAALDRAAAEDGWRIVLLVRLSGLIPFNIQNLAFGATRIGFAPYFLATVAGMVPFVAVYVWIGSLGAADMSEAGPLRWVIVGLGAAAAAAAIWLAGRKARAVLAAYEVQSEDSP